MALNFFPFFFFGVRRLLLLGIDAATAQLVAEKHLDGPLSPSRTLCAEVVEPTLKLWQQIATSPNLAQTPVCLHVVCQKRPTRVSKETY